MTVVVKAMHTASKHNIYRFAQWSLNVLRKFRLTTDTQAIDVVTFYFKGTHVRCFVSGSTDYQMNLS